MVDGSGVRWSNTGPYVMATARPDVAEGGG